MNSYTEKQENTPIDSTVPTTIETRFKVDKRPQKNVYKNTKKLLDILDDVTPSYVLGYN